MADEKKPSFPMLPVAHWWTLREKFKQSIPGIVTDSYLAAALYMRAESARVNILPPLKAIGLIDEEGKTQDLANEWRDDQQYAAICKKIKDRLYPEELSAAVEEPSKDRKAVERWFATKTGKGTSAVGRMATFYILLCEADVTKKPEKRPTKEKITKKQKLGANTGEKKGKPNGSSEPSIPNDKRSQTSSPSIHINLEIHISADATPDQIDKIFESMAKHIYKK